MVVTGNISNAAQINPSYSPEITNVHPHYMQFM